MIPMIPYERQQAILDKMKNGIVYISDLSEFFNVSDITIRRDLKELEKQGLIKILQGGAATSVNTTKETDFKQRAVLYSEEKEMIGKLAADCVNDNDTVFIDAGSTTISMFKFLQDKHVTIYTNGYNHIAEALKYNLDVTLIGGNLRPETSAFIGSLSVRNLELFHFDKCFLGVNGIDLQSGLTNAHEQEALLKLKAINHSKQAYILADESKFNSSSLVKFADLEDVVVITNTKVKEYLHFENWVFGEHNSVVE